MKLKLFICVFFVILKMEAKISLPTLFGDNMVLQQFSKVKIWGKSSPEKKISLLVPWLKDEQLTFSNRAGEWEIFICTPKAGGPYDIILSDGDTCKISNVYIGEVWLCSGQSNMEMPIKGFFSQPVLKSNQIIAEVDSSIPIHMFTVQRNASKIQKDDVVGSWKENTAEAVANFSAVAYFFGKELYSILKVPIGLINASWGASNIESWLPSDLLAKNYPAISLKHLLKEGNVKVPQQAASLLYNGMLYPLHQYRIKGTIWYQGEANRLRFKEYKSLFVSFVDHLRYLFNDPQMPLYYAQIAPFAYKDESVSLSGALLRESQLHCEQKMKNVGMAVLMDIGDSLCIHPSEKEIVGRRLAYWALKNDYLKKSVVSQSPQYMSQEIKDNKIILSFKYADMGLTSYGKKLQHFEIAGKDGKFYQAIAKIIGDKVEVWAEEVKNPVAVRYAFKNYVKGDLFGTSGLPVSSFRTNF